VRALDDRGVEQGIDDRHRRSPGSRGEFSYTIWKYADGDKGVARYARSVEAAEAQRPRRGRPSSLSHEQIVEAALRLIGSRRFDDVSMREIARELGVPVMTLYNYVANKDELSVLVVDHILRPVEVPSEDGRSWQERIRTLERDARRALNRYPGVSIRNGVRSPEALRLADGVVSILTSSGFSDEEATRMFGVLYTFMLGQVEVDGFFASAESGGEPTFEDITGGAQPTRDELFEFGFDVVLRGLDSLVAPAQRGDLRPPRSRQRTGDAD
jgi:AcrR family transcriptional regulator